MLAATHNDFGRGLEDMLPASPDAYPHNLDLAGGRVLILKLDAASYRAASFLDDRILAPSVRGAWLPGTAVTAAARRVRDPRPLHFIFHTGHVGSTLLSRLLDEAGSVLSLREPLTLRAAAGAHDVLGQPESLLAPAHFEVLLDMLLKLWARGYEGTRAVVVKATSTAGCIAPDLLARSPASRAVYLGLRAEPYLATLLGGVNSAIDLRGHGPGRMRRLLAGRSLPTGPLHALSAGELAALGWLAEEMARQAALEVPGTRVLALDFDGFLADVGGSLAKVLVHFGLPSDSGMVAKLAASQVLRQYSKAPQVPFPPGERAARLAQARSDHGAEIARGLAWLERMGRADAGLAAMLAEDA